MFEKEAEEYANEYGQDAFTQFNMPQWIEPIRRERKLGFQKGAEFGYNKANEWHKPSEKLPEECSLVLAYSFDDTEPSLWEFVTSDQWEWLPKRIVFCSNDQIRMWQEIVLPELKINDIPLVIDPCKMCKVYKKHNGWFMGEFKKGEWVDGACKMCTWFYDSKFEV